MRTYKTWEAIKELTENPKLKFKYDTGAEYGVIANINGDIKLIECAGQKISKCLCLYSGFLNVRWEPVREPVDFMTAIKANQKGKVIRYVLEDIDTQRHFPPYYNGNIYSTAILNGKWYIEE